MCLLWLLPPHNFRLRADELCQMIVRKKVFKYRCRFVLVMYVRVRVPPASETLITTAKTEPAKTR